MRTLSDADLLAAARSGCMASFEELYRRHQVALLGVARSTLAASERCDAHDLVADAFSRLLGALRNGAGPVDNPLPYLIVTVRNLHISRYRTRARSRALLERMVAGQPTTQSTPEPDADVATALRRLHPRHRRVLWWTEVEGRKPQEVADVLGISPDAAAALSYRARKAFAHAYRGPQPSEVA